MSNLFFRSDSGFSEYLDFCLKDNKLIIISSYEKTSYDTGITISKNTWHTLYFEFVYDTLKIKLDNNSVEKKFNTNISFFNFTTYLGCSNAYDEFQITDCAFDVLAYTSELNDELYDIVKNYRPSHIKNFYKDDGRIDKKELLLNWNTFVTNYHYLVKENKSKTLPDYVEDYLGNFVYYGYDNINNITNIVKLNDNNDEIESNYFEYNYLKQLSKDEYRGYSHHLKHEYTYTDNGNINSVIKTNLNNNEVIEYKYEYNNDIPNVLIKVTKCSNGEENDFYSLTYDENNPLKLTSYTKEGITYNVNYTANKISSIGNINFYYDTYGNRIEKTTPTETIYYQYDGNKLILTRNANTNVDVVYLYDNDEVIGFYTQNNYFLYEKDLTGNIIGIIDNAKVLLVKYIYNGYGVREAIIPDSLTLEQQELANFLINNNHLAYKGYIYDVETNLYYCKSRYYSPEIGRWLSGDSIVYLDVTNVIGTNLYVYCGNNPIMYLDKEGNFAYHFYHNKKTYSQSVFMVDGANGITTRNKTEIIFNYFGSSKKIIPGAINYNIYLSDNDKPIIVIYQSYKIKTKMMKDYVLKTIINSEEGKKHGLSMCYLHYYISEWTAHNFGYYNTSFIERCEDVDLSYDDTISIFLGLGGWIFEIWY